MAIERGFSLYQVYPYFVRKVEGGGGAGGRGGACLTLWPWGWALNRGRALIRAWALIGRNTVLKDGEDEQ